MNVAAMLLSNFGIRTKRLIYLILISLLVVITLPVAAVMSMGEDTLQFLAAQPNAEAAETEGFYMGGPIEGNTYEWGNCTYWTYAMRLWAGRPIGQYWGNANTWDDSALQEGYLVNNSPLVGAIFQTDAGQYGHVAYVVAVDKVTGQWTISEMNFPHLNVVSNRTFSADAARYYTFIHDKTGD